MPPDPSQPASPHKETSNLAGVRIHLQTLLRDEGQPPPLEELLGARADLRRETRRLLSLAGREGPTAFDRQLLDEVLTPIPTWREAFLQRTLAALAATPATSSEALLREAAQALQREVELLAADSAVADRERARVLTHWRLDLMVLEECLRRTCCSSRHGRLPALEARAQEIGTEAANLRALLADEERRPSDHVRLAERLRAPEACAARINLMRAQALRTWMEQASPDLAEPDLARRVCAAIAPLHAQLSIQLAAPAFEALRPEIEGACRSLEGIRDELLAGVRAHLESAPQATAREVRAAWTEELADDAIELLNHVEDLDLSEAVIALEVMRQRLHAFDGQIARGAPAAAQQSPARERATTGRDPLDTARRTLRRARRDLRAELDEKRLALRLERLLGRGIAAGIENLILFLILVVLGQLLYESFFPPPGNPFVLVVLDTSICALFLLEFALKISLAESRWRYFKRHWFVDLLPSIPFAIFFYWLHGAAALRSLRLLRLPRLVRYVRVARPLIRVLRLFLFLMRGMDRLVRRNAALLNRAILFCSDPLPPADRGERPAVALARARGVLARAERAAVADLPIAIRVDLLEHRTAILTRDMASFAPERTLDEHGVSATREVDIESVIRALRSLDAATVVDIMGSAFSSQFERALLLLRLPLIRHLPLLRSLVGKLPREEGSAELVAHFGRRLGLMLERINRVILWLRDLHGTITGPQLIDKLGTTLVKASARPARRMLGLGLAFVLLSALAMLTGITFLIGLTGTLAKFLGIPILILGCIAMVFFFLGAWMRRVAGSATEFFETIADAQYLRLTCLIKGQRRDQDLAFLHRRVIEPEEKLLVASGGQLEEHRPRLDHARLQLGLLYTDFEHSPPLSREDIKISTFLMGNLSLQNVMVATLRLTKKERKSLAALDLSRRSLLGPTLWFHFITSSISQRVARLVVDYNRYCLPLAALPSASGAQRRRFRRWLEARAQGESLEEENEGVSARERIESLARRSPGAGGRRGEVRAIARLMGQSYNTTEFHALHFLSQDEERNHMIRRRFGAEVEQQLRRDSRAVIREVFGTNPMSSFTREQLAFNPYRFYLRWLSGGKTFLLPLLLLLGALRITIFALRRVFHILREILHPSLQPAPQEPARSHYAIALRKVHRMRRPLYMACLKLRARIDPEYHGLRLPGLVEPTLRISNIHHDMRFIGCEVDESAELAGISRRFAEGLRNLEDFLQLIGLSGSTLLGELRRRGAPTSQPRGEQLRAATLAYLTNQHDLSDVVRGILIARGRSAPAQELDSRHERRRQRRERKRTLRRVRRLDRTVDPVEYVLQHLAREAARCASWSDQLLAVRAIQSLTVLDLDTYQDLIWQLGDYASDAHPRCLAEPPGLRGAPPASYQISAESR